MSRIVCLSEAGSIAIHSMVLIARSKEIMNVINIAKATEASKHHVAKVLQRLVKEGYLTSNRGPKGGFNDFAKFLIVRALHDGKEVEILVESGVYENLRIVGTNSKAIAELGADEIVKSLTDSLLEIASHQTVVVMSTDSTVNTK